MLTSLKPCSHLACMHVGETMCSAAAIEAFAVLFYSVLESLLDCAISRLLIWASYVDSRSLSKSAVSAGLL